jgi:HK97 gp10 family phage protein
VITVELIGDRELAARLDAMPGRVHDGLARAVTRLGRELQGKVQSEKLSGSPLKVRTGTLRSSIDVTVEDTGTKIAAGVGTNVFYGRFQEYGVGRSWLIEARNARSLAFEVGGKTIFRRRVTHPPMPERSFLRSALAEMAPAIEEELKAAVAAAIRE